MKKIILYILLAFTLTSYSQFGNRMLMGDVSVGEAWNISTASYLQSFSVATQDTGPFDVKFKSDGTKMYVLGSTGDNVYEYDLSTSWNVTTSSYLQSFYVGGEESNVGGITFKPDGTKMYMTGYGNLAEIHEYNLSTAWNISTASYLQSFSVISQDTFPVKVLFKPDGTKMYVLGFTNNNVYEYDLSTAWNISTASYLQSFSVNTQSPTPRGLSFKPDGTKMYVLDGVTNDAIYEYDLSTSWNVTTSSYLQSFSVNSQDNLPFGLTFKTDGIKMYVVGNTNDSVYEYNLIN